VDCTDTWPGVEAAEAAPLVRLATLDMLEWLCVDLDIGDAVVLFPPPELVPLCCSPPEIGTMISTFLKGTATFVSELFFRVPWSSIVMSVTWVLLQSRRSEITIG
jgi:hypothetical protein